MTNSYDWDVRVLNADRFYKSILVRVNNNTSAYIWLLSRTNAGVYAIEQIMFKRAKQYNTRLLQGTVVAMVIWWLDLQLPMQSVPITTDAMSSNLDQGEVYNIMW
jgi:hypothetical protein